MKNLIIILSFLLGGIYGYYNHKPLAVRSAVVQSVQAKESGNIRQDPAKSEPTEDEIIKEIYKVFSQSGKLVAIEAIRCAYSESKLKPYAVNEWNRDGSKDFGIFQINSVHGMKIVEAFDYRKNIAKAYQIYLNHGWSAWYGAGCHKGY